MMNTESSSKLKLIRFILLVPILITALVVFNTSANGNNSVAFVQKTANIAPIASHKHTTGCKKKTAGLCKKYKSK